MAGDPWRIGMEERTKHDSQFFQLKPVQGFVTGDQARNFFIQSGLPTPVLGQIWGLADMNADGRMDKKEFSIAMSLIKKKLQGFELPKVLPPGIKMDPVAGGMAPGGFGAQPVAGMQQGVGMGIPGGFGSAQPPQGMIGMTNGGTGMGSSTLPGGFGSPSRMPPGPTGTFPVDTRGRSGSASGEWSIPQAKKLQYNQAFNQFDRMRRGFLMGVEARGVLMQSKLPQQVLAQIWQLSDIDNDGKLTSEEFCLAMYLMDLAKMGQPLPAKLPPDLIPPSYRRGRAGSGLNMAPPAPGPVAPVAAAPPLQGRDAFSGLLGGGVIGGAAFPQPPAIGLIPQMPADEDLASMLQVTFEDKRKENFDKGAAELEKRREMLAAMQRKENEARLAKERAEQEKRERIRQEQERKKMMELEKHMQRQREVEQEREEQRRKLMEQRESARREMERQRQLEWERQRKEQLMAKKKKVPTATLR